MGQTRCLKRFRPASEPPTQCSHTYFGTLGEFRDREPLRSHRIRYAAKFGQQRPIRVLR